MSEVSLAVQWLRLRASIAGVPSSIPGLGTKIPYATWCSQKNNNNKKKPQVSELHSTWQGAEGVRQMGFVTPLQEALA